MQVLESRAKVGASLVLFVNITFLIPKVERTEAPGLEGGPEAAALWSS